MLTIMDQFTRLWPRRDRPGAHRRLPRLDAMRLGGHALDDLNLPSAVRGRLESDRLRALYDWPLGRI